MRQLDNMKINSVALSNMELKYDRIIAGIFFRVVLAYMVDIQGLGFNLNLNWTNAKLEYRKRTRERDSLFGSLH